MKDINDELIEKTVEVYGENLENLTIPTSKSIGNNIGLMVDGIFGWIGVWGQKQKIKQEKYIKDFKKNLNKKLENIPEDKIIEPKVNIIGPTLETAKYYFEEEYYKEMFTNLICASCNSEKSSNIHPSFIETIKQLSPLDAKLLNMFQYNTTYPVAEIQARNKDKTITPFPHILCDFKNKNQEFNEKETIHLSTSIENLVRLGIIMKNRAVIELKYDYNLFKSHFLYKIFEKGRKQDSKIEIIKYRIELTNYGTNFFNICIM